MSAAIASALCVPAPGNAAGLGQASVASGLGQPLRVEIEILNASTEELAGLTARLAPFSDSRNALAPTVPLPADLRVSIEQRGRRAIVLVTTRSPINEPFVVLPVELSLGGSGLVREFTLLLDPVEARSPGPTAPVDPPTVARAAAAAGDGNRLEATREVARSESTRSVAEGRSTSPRPGAVPIGPLPSAGIATATRAHVVQRGESLARIASRLRSADVTTAQVAATIYRWNPEAFIAGDVNRLIAGRTLTIPDAQVMRELDPADAAPLIGLRDDPTRVGAHGAQASRPSVQSASRGTDRLTLTPDRARQVDRIGIAEDRLADMEKTIERLESLVSRQALLIQKMVEHQGLARGDGALAAPSGAQHPGNWVAAPDTPPEAGNGGGAAAPDSRPAVTAADRVAPDGSQWPVVLSKGLVPVYAGLGVLLAGLAALYGARRARSGRDQRMPPQPAATRTTQRFTETRSAEAPSTLPTTADLDLDFSSNTGGASSRLEPAVRAPGAPAVDSVHPGLLDTEIDSIAEAEVYLAYGRNDQAEEVLRDALDRNPANAEVALRLLALYADRRNLPAMESVIQLLSAGTGERGAAWERALELRRTGKADGGRMAESESQTSPPWRIDPPAGTPQTTDRAPTLAAPSPGGQVVALALEEMVSTPAADRRDVA